MGINSKHIRHRRFGRIRYGRDLAAFLANEATDLTGTAATKAITPVRTTNTKAEGLLTITDADIGDIVSISGRAYKFVAALTEVKATNKLTLNANAETLDTVTIGDVVYTYKTALTEVKAARTFTGSSNPSNAQTIVIGTKTYTFQSSLTNVDGNIKIGADLAATLTNLKNAVNGSGGTPGTDYALANVAHTQVTASGTSPAFIATAKVPGVAGNAIACTGTAGGGSWAGTTLTGGVNPIGYELKLGANASDSLDALIAAINASGAGTVYSTGTVANPYVAAAAGAGDTMNITANVGGTSQNTVVCTTEVSNAAWDTDLLAGGVNATDFEVVVGNGTTEARDNLIAAINNGAGEGEQYGSGNGADPKVVASASSGNVLLTALLEANLSSGFSTATVVTVGDGITFGSTTLQGPGWTASSHGYVEGQGPFVLTNSGGALPAGSPAAGTELYVHVISANVIALAAGREALRKGNYIQTTTAGTGTHNLNRGVAAKNILSVAERGVNSRTIAAATDIDGL